MLDRFVCCCGCKCILRSRLLDKTRLSAAVGGIIGGRRRRWARCAGSDPMARHAVDTECKLLLLPNTKLFVVG